MGETVQFKEKIPFEWPRFIIMGFYLVALIVIGLAWPSEIPLWDQYKLILFDPGVLISDYFEIGGVSAALVNAGLTGLLALGLVFVTNTNLSGPTIAGVFTIAGFSLFGKTPLNVFPVILGVAVSTWLRRERFRSFILVALFGTAMGPIVTQVAYGLEMGYPAGFLAGMAAGMVLPGMASHVLHNHQGFNLYNIGFTCGIIGMYATGMLKLWGFDSELAMAWHTGSQQELATVFSIYFGSMILVGWKGRSSLGSLCQNPGTLVTDFVSLESFSAAFFNMGLIGLMGMAYIGLVGGEFNGPTLGGVFTIVGFGAFGKHVKNIWPLMLGVYLAAWASSNDPSKPGIVLAALFGTTLAPIAGGFGVIVGILAGVVHLSVVTHVGSFHGGMNLYNNGFAGGLVGTLFICTIRWLHLHRSSE